MTPLTRRVSPLLGMLFCLAAVAAQKPYLVDGDADAVSDEIDDCPYTQPGIRVDRKGCPLRRDDGDLDGVADEVDDCPYSAVGAVIDQKGCALDSDFDGVANGIDRCPRSLLAHPVNALGCAADERAEATTTAARKPSPTKATSQASIAAETVVMPTSSAAPLTTAAEAEIPLLLLRFGANSALLSKTDLALIQAYASVFQRRLASQPTAQIQLQAFADVRESDPTRRSAARLLAVRSALLARGIAEARIRSTAGVQRGGDASHQRRVEVRLSN